MKSLLQSLCLLLPLALASSLAAQDAADMTPPKPPAELAKFDVMLGNWTGSGTMHVSPDGAGEPWTAVSTGKKIMGGFFVQVDTKIDIGAPAPMLMREIYHWDAKRKCYGAFACGNDGSAQTNDLYFTDSGKLVYSNTQDMQGQLWHTSWTITFEKDKHSFIGRSSIDGGEFFPHIEGSMKRGGDGCDASADSANVALAPPSGKLEAVAKMKGNWTYTGWYKMMPDAPAIDIGGEEKVTAMFGGHLLAGVVKDKSPYRGNSYIYWCGRDKCIKIFGVSNFGEAHTTKMYAPTPDQLVMVFAGEEHGQPMSGSATMTFKGDTEVTGVSMALQGGKTVKTMEMKKTRAKP